MEPSREFTLNKYQMNDWAWGTARSDKENICQKFSSVSKKGTKLLVFIINKNNLK